MVIIGGSSGMGLGAARAAAAQGASVILGGHSPEKVEAAAAEIGDGATGYVVDVTQEDAIREFFDRMEHLDHLMVTAAPGSTGKFREQSPQDARSYMEGKFWTAYICAWYAAPKMPPTGSMVFISGGFSRRPKPGTAVVAASQSATEALARALSVELAPIRANTILPGTVDTDLWDYMEDDERQQFLKEAAQIPAGRVGTPVDIGHAAVFLMTNGFITGTVLELDGGLHLQ
ncbi:MAG: SDR family oxidoreductase [Armatimonadaceae bacterium]